MTSNLEIYQAIKENKANSPIELVNLFKLSKRTVYLHLSKLLDKGLIEKQIYWKDLRKTIYVVKNHEQRRKIHQR